MGKIKRKVKLAPIVFLVYNRPEHTRQVLEALMENELADQSDLYIYADGPKANAPNHQIDAINTVRNIIRSKQWCKNIEIFESNQNLGLANATVQGITNTVALNGKVIVLEDDILPSPYFLRYMNDALNLFENRLDIGSINAFSVDFLAKKKFPAYFLINNSDCWGWATWKNRWDDFSLDAAKLKEELIKNDKLTKFDYGGHIPILDGIIRGDINTWDIQWHAVNILLNRKGVFAKIPFVDNIGLDGSGTHYNTIPGKIPDRVKLNKYEISLREFVSESHLIYSEKIEQKFRKYYLKYFKISFTEKVIGLPKRIIRKIISYLNK